MFVHIFFYRHGASAGVVIFKSPAIPAYYTRDLEVLSSGEVHALCLAVRMEEIRQSVGSV